MDSFLGSNKSRNSRTNLNDLGGVVDVSNAEITSIHDNLDNLSVSKGSGSKLCHNLKKKKKKNGVENSEDMDCDDGLASFSGCFRLHVKGSGCKVGSCEDLDINCKSGKGIVDKAISLPENLWRKSYSRKDKGSDLRHSNSAPMLSLPDDVLEMILAMLPWTTLMDASRVCRKWRCLTGSTHFRQRRLEGYQKPCLFLFGVTRNGFNGGEIHALDISLDQWCRSTHNELKDRFLFSTASIGTDVYIVGGCCYSPYLSLRVSKNCLKDVLVFSPIKGSFHNAAPMKEGRSEPVLGVFEVSPSCKLFHNMVHPHGQNHTKSRACGNSDVYEDPHRFSLRRQVKDVGRNMEVDRNSIAYPVNPRRIRSNVALIVVGGHGSLDEPLDSGEIYDPITDKWVEIAPIPEAFGPVSSGTICNSMFYVYSEADKLARFDLETGNWTMIEVSHPPLHLSDYYPKLVFCKNRLFLLCVSWSEQDGLIGIREKAVRKMWELDLKYQSWSEVSRHPDAPMDSNAIFVSDQNKIFGLEMFRIFGQVLDFVTCCDVSGGEIRWSRVSRKHAAHDSDASSCITKSMLVVNL